MYILPYKAASKSAIALAEELGWSIIGRDIEVVRPLRHGTIVVNWGKGVIGPAYEHCRVINKPAVVRLAVNKIAAFNSFKAEGVRCPEWTTDKAVASRWLDTGKVCLRIIAEGKDGEGLLLMEGQRKDWFNRPLPLPDASFYSKFIEARAEYRINVCGGRTMGVQLKVPTRADANPDIKTGGNGYGFRLLEEREIPNGIRPVARAAIEALGLDFGGVDLIVDRNGSPYVLEVNTAPELTPAMVTAYAAKLRSM